MPQDPFAIATAGLALALLLSIWIGLAARAEASGLRREADRATALDHELRGQRDAHGDARNRASGLAQAVDGLRERLDAAERQRAELACTANGERAALAGRLDVARREIGDLRVANERLGRDLAARIAAHDAETALLRDMREGMADRFKALADATLRDHGERFGALNRERMEALLRPMREQVDHFQTELREAHGGAARDRERLKAEIEALSRRSEDVSREAVALTRALKGDKQRQGAWGEMILGRVLEASGLTEGREYETQPTVRDRDGGHRRPDVLVRLPGGKVVVIDAKVSLVAYEASANAADEAERAAKIRAHAAAVRAHVDALARRDYAGMVEGAVDYVVMFLPVEGALCAALEGQDDLTSHAMRHRAGIATPTTLMMALRTISYVWKVERRESNAEEIARRAGLLFDKMAGVVEAFQRVGEHLGRAQSERGRALDRLSRGGGNVLGQFDRLRDLGARTSKPLPAPFDRAAGAPGRSDRSTASLRLTAGRRAQGLPAGWSSVFGGNRSSGSTSVSVVTEFGSWVVPIGLSAGTIFGSRPCPGSEDRLSRMVMAVS